MRTLIKKVRRACWIQPPLRLDQPTAADPSSVTGPATSATSSDNAGLSGKASEPLACGTPFGPASLVSFCWSPDASSSLSVFIKLTFFYFNFTPFLLLFLT